MLRTTAIHQLIIVAFTLGIPSKWLARLHPPNNRIARSIK
jgi:hypothetical protein